MNRTDDIHDLDDSGLARILAGTTPADEDLGRLHERLAAVADADGLLDVAYATLDSPVGSLLVAASARGVLRIGFAVEDHDAVLDDLGRRVSPRILHAPRRLDEARTELDEYFAGERTRFELPLDPALSSGFRAEVRRRLPDIPYGTTWTYRDLAELVGSPRAFRAVGSACATNPLPIVVPCHRVIRGDGSLGGYIGGLDAKRALLALEAAA